jgi:hypothetical protein
VGAGGAERLSGPVAFLRDAANASIAALAASGLPLVAHASLAATLALAVCIGAGQMITEVTVDTTLQRTLDPAVFARSYGLVVPAASEGSSSEPCWRGRASRSSGSTARSRSPAPPWWPMERSPSARVGRAAPSPV